MIYVYCIYIVIDLWVKPPHIMTSFMHMCHVPPFADATLHFGSRTGKKGVSPVLLVLEETHITTTLGLGVGV